MCERGRERERKIGENRKMELYDKSKCVKWLTRREKKKEKEKKKKEKKN